MTDIKHNATDRRNGRAYLRDFLPAVIGYVVAMLIVIVAFDQIESWWRYIVVLLPVVPALWGARAIARQLNRVDEYQRIVQLNAMSVGFGAAMITAVTIGMLSVGGVPTERWGAWAIYTAGMLGWLVAAGRCMAAARD